MYFYFDDSGVFHSSNTVGRFVYGGYVFTNRNEKETAYRKYKALVQKIRQSNNMKGELKACRLANKHKRALYKVLSKYQSLGIVINLKKLPPGILDNSHSICRYKDFAITKMVTKAIEYGIKHDYLNPYYSLKIYLNIDEQLRSTDGIYNLAEAIEEDLKFGFKYYNYSKHDEPVWKGDFQINLKYCVSECNYLIQAADIMANRIYNSYARNHPEYRVIPNHHFLYLP